MPDDWRNGAVPASITHQIATTSGSRFAASVAESSGNTITNHLTEMLSYEIFLESKPISTINT